MMNELQIFQNDEFGQIRTLMIDNLPWFVGKDVATAFGDTNYKRSLSRLDADEKTTAKVTTPGGIQSMTVINESGLYSLLFYMQPQKAKGVSQNDILINDRINNLKKFKRWVTSEVLPAIRKNGSYTVEPELPERKITSDDYIRAASIISTCKNERLPYVLNLLKQGGINVPYIAKNGSVDNDTDGEAARLINTAVNDYGMSLRGIGRLTGLQPTQLTRIRTGNSIPTMQRAKIICDAIREAIPDIE